MRKTAGKSIIKTAVFNCLRNKLLVLRFLNFYQRVFVFLALYEALKELSKSTEQKAKIVKLWYFGDLLFKEAAEVLGVSEVTVKRQWRVAKGWLYDKLKTE